jgi:hypothetical protein
MVMRMPTTTWIKSTLATKPAMSAIKYGLTGAILTPLIDIAARKLVTIPSNVILPQIPTLDQWLMNLGVPGAILLSGVAFNKPSLAWVGIGGLIYGTANVTAQTVIINLPAIGIVKAGIPIVTTALGRYGA